MVISVIKIFLVLEIELRDENCPFYTVWVLFGKNVIPDRRRYLRKTKFLSKNLIKVIWAKLGFRNFTWQVMVCVARKLMVCVVTIHNFFRSEFMISLCDTCFYLENHQSALFKTGRKDFHNELVEKILSGYPLNHSKMLLHEHLKKRERSMLLFKLDTSHARIGLLLPRSGSRVNKSQLPDESS